jgi:hypothetical protein
MISRAREIFRVRRSGLGQALSVSDIGRAPWVGFTPSGVEVMNKLVEIRSQEFICRERAALDFERRSFWLAQAEQWEQRALDEIAYHFRECNLDRAEPSLPTDLS